VKRYAENIQEIESPEEKSAQSEDLLDALLLLKSRDEAQRFLKDLCTPQELIALHERWKVCQLLYSNELSYRQINELTGTSLATIVRVARCLKDEPTQGYKIVLNRIKQKKTKDKS
jgi:TrpR-related protein YerC/YecD